MRLSARLANSSCTRWQGDPRILANVQAHSVFVPRQPSLRLSRQPTAVSARDYTLSRFSKIEVDPNCDEQGERIAENPVTSCRLIRFTFRVRIKKKTGRGREREKERQGEGEGKRETRRVLRDGCRVAVTTPGQADWNVKRK